jgi:DNA polymerase III gamma/tau subunit
MNQSQALARKYRPQKFAEVLGQEHVTKALKMPLLQLK